MTDLSVTYAGLELKSPIIVSSSGLTSSVERIKKIADAGAGAVVLKSLFEEQILLETEAMAVESDYPGAAEYLHTYARENRLNNYLTLIKESKEAVAIPVIASINCHSKSEWVDYTVRMQEAGADALELNVYYMAKDKKKDPREYEQVYMDIVEAVAAKVSIPVIVKLGMHFTNLSWMTDQLASRGAKAVVLFNRFYTPDIDTDKLEMGSSEVLSTSVDMRHSLRWIGILSSEIENVDFSASTGVHNGIGAVKQLLAGAETVQVCSVLYRNGVDYLGAIINEMKVWMEKKQYRKISEFRGKMSYGNIEDPEVYERAQFIKYFAKLH